MTATRIIPPARMARRMAPAARAARQVLAVVCGGLGGVAFTGTPMGTTSTIFFRLGSAAARSRITA